MFEAIIKKFMDMARRRGPSWSIETWLPTEPLAVKQRSLLRLMAAAHSQRVDVLPLIRGLASESRGRYRRILKQLSNRLSAGLPLIDALEQTPEALSDHAVLALRLASQSGTLTATYEMLLPELKRFHLEQQRQARGVLVYWITISVVLGLHFLLLFTITAPTIAKIFEDFGLRLPIMLEIFIWIGAFLSRFRFWLLSLIVIGLWLRFSPSASRWMRRDVVPRLSNSIDRLRRIELLEMLGVALQHGRPIPGILSTLARYHYNKHFRSRLLYARNEVEQGSEVWQSLADARLIGKCESSALSSNRDPGMTAWIIKKLAEVKRSQGELGSRTRFTLLQPLVMLAFAILVLAVCAGYLAFTTQLMYSLC